MNERVKQLEEGIRYLLEEIEYNQFLIESDCRDNGGPMSGVNFTKLKVYNEMHEALTAILGGEDE